MKIRSYTLLPILLLILVACGGGTEKKYDMLSMSFNSPYTLAISQPYIPVDGWSVINQAKQLKYGKDSDGFSLKITSVDYKTNVYASTIDGTFAIQYDNFAAKYDVPIGYSSDSTTLANGVKSKTYRGNFTLGNDEVLFIVAIYKQELKTYTFEIYYTKDRLEKDPHIAPDMEDMLNSISFKQEDK